MVAIGVAPLLDAYFRRRFLAAGLVPLTVPLDSGATVLHYWAPPHPPTKPLLLLLHGFGPPATWQWRRQVGPLSRHFSLIVPDLLFFGSSTSTRAPPPFTDADQAAAVAALLAALGVRTSVSVAGTSYGGFVAYRLAQLLGPEVVDRVVIASSDLLKADLDDRALLRRAGGVERVSDLMVPTRPDRMRALIRLAFHHPPRFLPDFVLRDLIKHIYNDKLEGKLELIKGITLGKKDEFQLTPILQEVLVMWGEHDQIFPIEKAFEVTRKLGDNARLEILKNTGHMPQEEDPDRFNVLLVHFLLPAQRSSM